MKPYIRAAFNYSRLSFLRWFRRCNVHFTAVTLLSYNTRLHVEKTARISLGAHLVSDGRTVIVVGENATLFIGDNVYFNENAMISSKESIIIKDGCRFGPNVKVFDNDHCFDAESGVSTAHRTAPIVIGRNCWLASNVVILRGTTIGNNCVIGANCVVHGIIPDGSIVTQSRNLTIKPMEI